METSEAYKYMRAGQHPRWAGQRPCAFTVLVYYPINAAQSRKLSDLRAKNSNYFAAGVMVITTTVSKNKVAGFAVGAIARNYIPEKLIVFDVGDILVRFDARISGGIGQQGHVSSVIIKRSAYDPNSVSP